MPVLQANRRCAQIQEFPLPPSSLPLPLLLGVGPLYSLIVQYAAECGLDVSVGRAWIVFQLGLLAFWGVVLRLVARKDINYKTSLGIPSPRRPRGRTAEPHTSGRDFSSRSLRFFI